MRIEVGEFGDTPCLFPLPELEKNYCSLYFTPFQNYMSSEALEVPLTPLRKNSHGLLMIDLLHGARHHAGEVALAAAEQHEADGGETLTLDEEEEEAAKDVKEADDPIIDKQYIVGFHKSYGHAPPLKIAKVFYHLRNPGILKLGERSI